MTDEELRVLAHVALHCDYPGPRGDRPPRWIVDLATDGTLPSGHTHDRLRHEGLVTWGSMGWKLTEAGWRALDEQAPEVRR